MPDVYMHDIDMRDALWDNFFPLRAHFLFLQVLSSRVRTGMMMRESLNSLCLKAHK